MLAKHMDGYLDIYHNIFEGFETRHFDSRGITREAARRLYEELKNYYRTYSLPDKSPGEHWPHVGETIYPLRMAAIFQDMGHAKRAEKAKSLEDSYYLPQIYRALLFAHGVVLWDPVFRALELSFSNSPFAQLSFEHLRQDRIMTVQDLAPDIRNGLVRFTPFEDITYLGFKLIGDIDERENDPERISARFCEGLQTLRETAGNSAGDIFPYAQYYAGWVRYRVNSGLKFDLFSPFCEDFNGLSYFLKKQGLSSLEDRDTTLAQLSTGIDLDVAQSCSIRDLASLRDGILNSPGNSN